MHFNKPFQLFILFITSSKLLQSHQILLCALVFWNYNIIHDKKSIFLLLYLSMWNITIYCELNKFLSFLLQYAIITTHSFPVSVI